jgi:hypothetical protein
MTLWVTQTNTQDGRTLQHVYGIISEPGELELANEALHPITLMVSSDGADLNGHTIVHNHIVDGSYVGWVTEVSA